MSRVARNRSLSTYSPQETAQVLKPLQRARWEEPVPLENHFERGCPSIPVDWSARLDARDYHATSVKRPDTKARWVGATRQSEDDGWTEGDAIIAFDAEDPSTEPQSEPASRTTSRRRHSGEPLPRAQPPPTRVRKRRSCPQLALTTCAHDTCICS